MHHAHLPNLTRQFDQADAAEFLIDMMPEELRTEKIIIKRELKADVSKCDDLVAVLDRCKLDVFEAQKPGSALKPAFSSLCPTSSSSTWRRWHT